MRTLILKLDDFPTLQHVQQLIGAFELVEDLPLVSIQIEANRIELHGPAEIVDLVERKLGDLVEGKLGEIARQSEPQTSPPTKTSRRWVGGKGCYVLLPMIVETDFPPCGPDCRCALCRDERARLPAGAPLCELDIRKGGTRAPGHEGYGCGWPGCEYECDIAETPA